MDATADRQRSVAVVRIVSGLARTVDAGLRWQPGSVHGSSLSTMRQARADQPALVKDWIALWIGFVAPTPGFWAYAPAAAETAVAICLVLGASTNLVCVAGGVLSFALWTAAEGLGGPDTNGAADVGASIVYVPCSPPDTRLHRCTPGAGHLAATPDRLPRTGSARTPAPATICHSVVESKPIH